MNLFSLLPESLVKAWWDSQWKKNKAAWNFGKKGRQDVRECLQFSPEDREAVKVLLARIQKTHDLSKLGDDMKARRIMIEVLRLYPQPKSYRYDSDKHKVPEYWQSPAETIKDGTGDCDDWGILLYALLREAGIPAYRLKAVVTMVRYKGKDQGLHFNLIYLAREDYEWYTMEGTWFPESAWQRFLHIPRSLSGDLYGGIRFTFNEEHAWAQEDLNVKPVFINPKKVL